MRLWAVTWIASGLAAARRRRRRGEGVRVRRRRLSGGGGYSSQAAGHIGGGGYSSRSHGSSHHPRSPHHPLWLRGHISRARSSRHPLWLRGHISRARSSHQGTHQVTPGTSHGSGTQSGAASSQVVRPIGSRYRAALQSARYACGDRAGMLARPSRAHAARGTCGGAPSGGMARWNLWHARPAGHVLVLDM